MKAESRTLQEILYAPSRYIIPVFQRYYSWSEANWERLWKDVIDLTEDGQQDKHHFMGSLVFVPNHFMAGQLPSLQVVDGQQRLITLSILLCALRDHAASLDFAALTAEIEQQYITHPFEKGETRLRVFPRQRDRHDYLMIAFAKELRDHNISIDIDDASGAGKAYHYFRKQLTSFLVNGTEQEVRGFLDIVRSRMEFVSITLNSENPYQIFKSLNSTGVDLSESDLIRNFIFMHIDTPDQDKFDDTYWKPLEQHFEHTEGKLKGQLDGRASSGFFRDFLMRDGQYVAPDATFEALDKQYEGTSLNTVALAKEFEQHVNYYDVLRGRNKHPSFDVNQALAQLRALNVTTAYPLLLHLMEQTTTGVVNDADLSKAIRLISGFVFRRLVCGEQSRPYGRWFVAACKTFSINPLEDLRQFLKDKVYPGDARFKDNFVRFKLYRSIDDKFLLGELEHEHPNHVSNEPVDMTKVQVEHIMPQKLTPVWQAHLGSDATRIYNEWLHTPGNLTLTGYNQSFGNRGFTEKCSGWTGADGKKVPGYKDSNIAITKEIAQAATWTEAEIIQRGQRLAELAATVFVNGDF